MGWRESKLVVVGMKIVEGMMKVIIIIRYSVGVV